jgi:hypothetical protein
VNSAVVIHEINRLAVRLISTTNQLNYCFRCLTKPSGRRIFTYSLLACLFLAVPLTLAQEPDANGEKPSWPTHSHDVQHTGVSSVPSEPLRRIRWQTPVDLKPQISSGNLFIHYGSPLVTAKNTVVVPMKTQAAGGFRVEGRNGRSGALKWSLDSDYRVPSAAFTPSFGPVLSRDKVVVPAAGGTILIRQDDDVPNAAVVRVAFYGLDDFRANRQVFTENVKINTPITADHQGNLFFGFMVLGPIPIPLQSGLARIGSNGSSSWISAAVASDDPSITKINMNCAPALSNDEKNLYIGVNSSDFGFGYLLELNSTTLQPFNKVRLKDPFSGSDALITDQSSATPTVGPDGDVYFGVLENPFPFHNDRGWLLHFSADLRHEKIPGGFGWDDTASVVDASLVPSYQGTSSYLLMTKYNNYASRGGDGVNKLAILDPNASTPDFILGNPVMNEVLTIAGLTPDSEFPFFPNAVREWCINTAAVDPFTRSVLANSEDGKLYRWNLTTNSFSQIISLTGGIGEAYTPTVIGVDGTAYAINRAVLFAIGR